ncbi:Dfp1/Him1, central region-domain-containing protein [Amylocarpus encephaloides]|uniref:Dfp1/Him1, central region-domain-containing protein n=1 Tax=Amylocarpus encephaloides TaxID=45428 RepID=A0A9P8C846_9HELO|nr:Dfp1/Him1, central region-domain-containing protein [Amylocarpus encephaloides]
MAAVSISPLPIDLPNMSSRRQPLLSNLNAVNSPCRPPANVISKQKRSHANIQREDAYGQPPPAKKQMLDSWQALRTPPRQHSVRPQAEGRVYTRRANGSQNPTLERRSVVVRERNAQHTNTKADKTEDENLETIRAWQKHYRKVFPTFVFYFESVPEDTRLKYTKHVTALGAREEKFFSNAVTHVVTTRSIPTEQVSPVELASSTTTESNSQNSQPQTINPSLLDRSSESTHVQSDSFTTKGKFSFESQISRRLGPQVNDAEIRRQQVRNADVLHRARELNMKIWALEKLQRMMTTMFDTETGYQVSHGHNTRGNSVQGTASIPRATADLSQLLRNEKLNGPSDRDLTVASKELCIFKGPYIYIHDIDEKQRPIMVREYAKVAHKEEGEWPQFRSVTGGKCPFIDEPDHSRRDHEKEQLRLQRQQERERTMASRTRAATADHASKMQPPRPVQAKPVMGELDVRSARNVTVSTKQSNPFAPNKSSLPRGTDVEASSRGNAFVSRAGGGRLLGGEPVASGLQPSNVTSAIRSQMISSTSAQPGARAGTSKEVHGLQRKVLEKNSGGPGSYGLTSSHRMTDITAAAREDANYRQTRRKEKLGLIREDSYQSEAETNARKIEEARKAKTIQQRKSEKRDAKPGYCENCQDKFDDFDEHILSRKHRKFAEKADNWKELDALLNRLARPVKETDEYSDEFYTT